MLAVAITAGAPDSSARAPCRAAAARDVRLQDRVGAGRAAAEVRVGHGGEREARVAQDRLDHARDLQPVLQAAGRMERDASAAASRRRAAARARARSAATTSEMSFASAEMRAAFAAYCRIALQQVPVVLHHRAAAARRDHDRLGARSRRSGHHASMLALHVGERLVLVVEVERDRAAAAGRGASHERDAEAVEHARGRGVDRGRDRRLHAAVAARACGARAAPRATRPRVAPRGNLARERARQQRPRACARAPAPRRRARACGSVRLRNQRRMRSRGVRGTFSSTSVAADVDEPPVLHARRTRRLARAAGEAAVEVQLRALA